MSVEENTRLDEEFIAAINAHDVERFMDLLSNDVVLTNVGQPEPVRGKVAFGQHYQGIFQTFPDYNVEVKNRVVSEDQVATEVEFSGIHAGLLYLGPDDPIPPTGNKFTANGVYFARIYNGKIVEMRQYPDVAGLLMQIGLIPVPGKGGVKPDSQSFHSPCL